MRKLTTAEFVERARETHGEKYNYSKAEYVDARSKVTIICPIHGEYLQVPYQHMKGGGCPGCKADNLRTRRLKTPQDFMDDAIALHGGRYNYSKVVYKGSKTKVIIGCSEHGDFEQLPRAHLQGSGCPACGDQAGVEKRQKTNKEFIDAAVKVHGNTYDYSKVEYKGAFDKIRIICPDHGVFEQAPTNHLSGNGCPACKSEKMLLSTDTFIERAINVHGDKYDYSKTEYVHGRKPIIIICPEHGQFTQRAGTHLEGKGCPLCSERGFKHDMPGLLYYLRVTSPVRTVYKIGVTNRSVEERFEEWDRNKITIIKTWDFAVGRDAYEKEQAILKEYEQFRYTGIDNPLESGNTELFTRDVLGLDKDYS